MSAETTKLFLLVDLESSGRTRTVADHDLNALRATAGWIEGFIIRHGILSRGVYGQFLRICGRLVFPAGTKLGLSLQGQEHRNCKGH
jgi:hypothetical protein